jgi:hypothetical protein
VPTAMLESRSNQKQRQNMSTASNSVMPVMSYPKVDYTNSDQLATNSLRQGRVIELTDLI